MTTDINPRPVDEPEGKDRAGFTLPELPHPPPPPEIPELLQQPTPKGNPKVGQPRARHPDLMSQWGRVFVIGTNFAAAVIGFSLIGYVLDRWLGTGPWLLLVGIGLGLIGGFVGFLREAGRMGRRPPTPP
jgi:ATP synthase protein I